MEEVTLTLTQEDMDLIGNLVADMPYRSVAPLVNWINSQVTKKSAEYSIRFQPSQLAALQQLFIPYSAVINFANKIKGQLDNTAIETVQPKTCD